MRPWPCRRNLGVFFDDFASLRPMWHGLPRAGSPGSLAELNRSGGFSPRARRGVFYSQSNSFQTFEAGSRSSRHGWKSESPSKGFCVDSSGVIVTMMDCSALLQGWEQVINEQGIVEHAALTGVLLPRLCIRCRLRELRSPRAHDDR